MSNWKESREAPYTEKKFRNTNVLNTKDLGYTCVKY